MNVLMQIELMHTAYSVSGKGIGCYNHLQTFLNSYRIQISFFLDSLNCHIVHKSIWLYFFATLELTAICSTLIDIFPSGFNRLGKS